CAAQRGMTDTEVRVAGRSSCWTESQIYCWQRLMEKPGKAPPATGHELRGKGGGARRGVSDLREGDIVSGETHINCGRCFQCRTGNGHICERMLLRGVDTDGCFSEYHTLHESSAWLNDKRIPIETASAQEPLGSAVHAASASYIPAHTVAVFGCGPIGDCLFGLCKSFGASKIFGIDIVEYRLNL